MAGGGSAGRGRARGAVLAERVNAAADLLQAGASAGEAAEHLADWFGCSVRQAHRYVKRAAASGRVPVPAEQVVFTVRLPVPLIDRLRGYAATSGRTISAVVAQALEEFLARTHRRPPGR